MGYKNFDAAIYCRVSDLNGIRNLSEFEKSLDFIEKHLKLSKVYLETYRGGEEISREKMIAIKEMFNKRGIRTSGGITTLATAEFGGIGFNPFCYTSEEHRSRLKRIVEFTAGIFDEIILDDFYFTNCKCESCIKAKGTQSWEKFRTELMKQASEELVLKPARAINPKVNMIIKYPNWYEHYQETGYNLADEPVLFDMIYTGTETRDPHYTQQHLPKYLSYFIMRYMENVKPVRNGGGWIDPYECSYNLGSYTEQAILTLLGKAKEITLFCLSTLLEESFSVFIPLAGHTFNLMDEKLGQLGTPTGTACYIPYHSSGEDFLHNYIGMLGIPLEPYPEYPNMQKNIFLTENAAKDSEIITKIHTSLINGENVIITSGLLKTLQDKGFDAITNIRVTDKKAMVCEYAVSDKGISFDRDAVSDKSIQIPVLSYFTNDAWQMAAGLGENNNYPILLRTAYGKGHLFVLTIPDDFGDLYHYPKEVLKAVREVFMNKAPVTLDASGKIALFTYDNDTFVVESFLSVPRDVDVIVNREGASLISISCGEETKGLTKDGKTTVSVNIPAASYKVFKIK